MPLPPFLTASTWWTVTLCLGLIWWGLVFSGQLAAHTNQSYLERQLCEDHVIKEVLCLQTGDNPPTLWRYDGTTLTQVGGAGGGGVTTLEQAKQGGPITSAASPATGFERCNSGASTCVGFPRLVDYQGPSGMVTEGRDASDNVMPMDFATRDGQTTRFRIGDGAGSLADCITLRDDGVLLYDARESCRGLQPIALPAGMFHVQGLAVRHLDEALVSGGLREDYLTFTDVATDGIHVRLPLPTTFAGSTILLSMTSVHVGATPSLEFEMNCSCDLVADSGAWATTISTTGQQPLTTTYTTQHDEEYSNIATIACNGATSGRRTLRLQCRVDATDSDTLVTDVRVMDFMLWYRRTQSHDE